MERKIGEIFEYKGEWYQCITDTTDDNCNNCFFQKSCSDITGDCSSTVRSDGESVAFKKLEKVGKPVEYNGGLYQGYKAIDTAIDVCNKACVFSEISCGEAVVCKKGMFYVAIKQNQEDMEEKKLNLKPFDIQKAREGKPVCTRDGRKARIICFDVKAKKSIAALITNDDTEEVHFYYDNGRSDQYQEYHYDLMMLPEKKEGWVNVMKGTAGKVYVGNNIYRTEDEAKKGASRFTSKLIANVHIEWEE